MRLLNLTLSVSILLFISGCATVSLPPADKMKAELSGYSLPLNPDNENGVVFIVRPGIGAPAVSFDVYLDSKEKSKMIGFNGPDEYLFVPLKPGKYTIYSKAENWAEIELNIEANQWVFLKQTPKIGILFARNDLSKIDDLSGKYFVKNLKVGKFSKKYSPSNLNRKIYKESRNTKYQITPSDKQLNLRRERSKLLLWDNVKHMVTRYNFFEKNINPGGDFPNNYQFYNEGVIADTKTGLCWQQDGSAKPTLHHNIDDYINSLNSNRFGGLSDWRLPTLEELASIMDNQAQNHLFIDPIFQSFQERCWTADLANPSHDKTNEEAAWIVDFANGKITKSNWFSVVPHSWYVDLEVHPKNYIKAVCLCK